MTYKPSKYQKAIYDWIKNDKGNALIQAVAGSGKTTTIVECAKLIPQDEKSIFVAFNKAIAMELNDRLPENVPARTLHSYGLGLFYKRFGSAPKVKFTKLMDTIETILKEEGYDSENPAFTNYKFLIRKLVQPLKAELTDYEDFGEVNDVVLRKGFDFELTDKIFDLTKKVMERCRHTTQIIDFDDMIWIPVVNKFDKILYDWVFVDESQDLNKSQFELIKMMCGKFTRIVAVGDRSQAIYAFRGADSRSMDRFKEEFKAKEMPLSICYRCPNNHIELAREIVPHIEGTKKGKIGIIKDLHSEQALGTAKDGDLVLCRTNAPLVPFAFALIRDGKKAIIRGRNIGKNLITMISKYKVNQLNDLIERIIEFQKLQEEKLFLIEDGKMDARKKNALFSVIDSCETVRFIAEECTTIPELKTKIETIFSDEKEGIVCSSVHKAKGLEADTVFILNYHLMPHPMAKTDEEKQQEMNIKYVALTRSKANLYFVKEDG